MFLVMRRPCLPEDEGRHFHERSFKSKQEAKEWIAGQKGYFRPSDFYVVDANPKEVT